jgi:hypothetical protein
MAIFGIPLFALVLWAEFNFITQPAPTFPPDPSYLLVKTIVVVMFGIPLAATGALVVNFVLSLLTIARIIPSPSSKHSSRNPETHKKAQPHRRKDYK